MRIGGPKIVIGDSSEPSKSVELVTGGTESASCFHRLDNPLVNVAAIANPGLCTSEQENGIVGTAHRGPEPHFTLVTAGKFPRKHQKL